MKGLQAPSAARGSQAFKIRLRGCRLMGVCLDTVPTACNAGTGPAGLTDRTRERNRARGIAAANREVKGASCSDQGTGREEVRVSPALESWAKLGCGRISILGRQISSGGLGLGGRQPGFVSQLCHL